MRSSTVIAEAVMLLESKADGRCERSLPYDNSKLAKNKYLNATTRIARMQPEICRETEKVPLPGYIH
jgi:hypothetical protein